MCSAESSSESSTEVKLEGMRGAGGVGEAEGFEEWAEIIESGSEMSTEAMSEGLG